MHKLTPYLNFFSFSHLRRDLRNNHLIAFTGDIFKPLVKLEVLYLNGNDIMALTTNMIPPLTTLLTLSLSDNQIQFIAKNSLILPALENL